jgi:hypothetical protein
VGQNSSVGIATSYGLDGPAIECRWGARFTAPVQTDPGAHPAYYIMGSGYFPGIQRPGSGVDHPPQSITEVKERVQLYLYSPFGPSWPVLGWALHYVTLHYFTLHYITLSKAGSCLMFGTAITLLLPEWFMNFEVQKPIFFSALQPRKETLLYVILSIATVLEEQGRTHRGMELYYCINCMKIVANELITLHQITCFFSVHKSLMSMHCRKQEGR